MKLTSELVSCYSYAMADRSQAQISECFQLALLQVLPRYLKRENYVVKGGANLRYFFKSVRYSEDIDFDALASESWRLEEKVDEALAAGALAILLRQKGIRVTSINKSQQTDTTQRWKLSLAVPDLNDAISTTVEFSRRNGEKRFLLEAVAADVVQPYGFLRPTLLHYTAAPATEQKIAALALRNETQARDVLDLDLLFRAYPGAVASAAVAPARLGEAAERCLELPFDAFRAQVLPFLDPEIAGLYDDPTVWAQIRDFVYERLLALDAGN